MIFRRPKGNPRSYRAVMMRTTIPSPSHICPQSSEGRLCIELDYASCLWCATRSKLHADIGIILCWIFYGFVYQPVSGQDLSEKKCVCTAYRLCVFWFTEIQSSHCVGGQCSVNSSNMVNLSPGCTSRTHLLAHGSYSIKMNWRNRDRDASGIQIGTPLRVWT